MYRFPGRQGFSLESVREVKFFDVVLDDGNHEMDYQILTFETLFPLLNLESYNSYSKSLLPDTCL